MSPFRYMGVRPSSGAAITRPRGSSNHLTVLDRKCVAAPGDGRTPSRRKTQPLVSVAKARATPRPFLGQRDQACLGRIILNVMPRSHFVVSVSHVSIPVTILPESSFPTQNPVRFLSGKTFPRIYQLTHRDVLHPKEQMNMVRHYHPSSQLVLSVMTESQRLFNQARNLGPSEKTFTSAFVQVSFQFELPLALVFNRQECLPFSTHFLWKRIRAPERDELDQSRLVPVRQITIFVPTAKPLLDLFLSQRTHPLPLASHEISYAWIVGWTRQALRLHKRNERSKHGPLTRTECACPRARQQPTDDRHRIIPPPERKSIAAPGDRRTPSLSAGTRKLF